MQKVVNAIDNVITFFKFLFRIINQLLNNTIRVVGYIGSIVPKIATFILTLPPYIQIFATMTIGISIAYLLLGRNSGKSD